MGVKQAHQLRSPSRRPHPPSPPLPAPARSFPRDLAKKAGAERGGSGAERASASTPAPPLSGPASSAEGLREARGRAGERGRGGEVCGKHAEVRGQRPWVSPPTREGPTFTGIAGTQGPTWWRGRRTLRCRIAHRCARLACSHRWRGKSEMVKLPLGWAAFVRRSIAAPPRGEVALGACRPQTPPPLGRRVVPKSAPPAAETISAGAQVQQS